MQQLNSTNLVSAISLHANILDVLFKHKKEVSRKLSDIRGIYLLEHISINITNPHNESVIFSITPSVEYNLITKDLWRFDKSFHPICYPDKAFFWWDQAYMPAYRDQIKLLKEVMHNFSLGFSLVRKITDFHMVYSFATRNRNMNLKSYYSGLIEELFHVGDYGYKLLREVYIDYYASVLPPQIEVISQQLAKNEKPYLRLIVDNNK